MTPAQKRTLADTLDAVLWQELMRLRRIIVPELVARPYATTMPYYSQWLLALEDHARVTFILACGLQRRDLLKRRRPRLFADTPADDGGIEEVMDRLSGRRWQRPLIGKAVIPKSLRVVFEDVVGEVTARHAAALRASQDYGLKLADVTAETVLANIQRTVVTGLAAGLSGEEIEAWLLERGALPPDASLGWPKHRIARLVRTETMRHLNNGELAETYSDDAIVAWRYSAILDLRTSDLCRHLHGKIIHRHQLQTGGMGAPPFHPHCRTIMLPIFQWQAEELERDGFDWSLPKETVVDGKPRRLDVARPRNARSGQREPMGTVDIPLPVPA
jgi:SPP1 gp7 family putative phage head morphogenesis protein